MLELALGNLLANAIKFAPVGSEIGFSAIVTQPASRPSKTFTTGTETGTGTGTGRKRAADLLADCICFRIDDAGPGIPADEREFVFARFHRGSAATGREGSGLGLAIVAAVALHGGWVACGDSPGGGARLELCLPRIGADPA